MSLKSANLLLSTGRSSGLQDNHARDKQASLNDLSCVQLGWLFVFRVWASNELYACRHRRRCDKTQAILNLIDRTMTILRSYSG